jgi:hypothetical protein
MILPVGPLPRLQRAPLLAVAQACLSLDTKELKISTLANGYRDIIARIDLDTYRRTPTTPSLPFFLLTFIEPTTSKSLSACPRGTLKRVVEDLKTEGLEAYAGAEVRLTVRRRCAADGELIILLCSFSSSTSTSSTRRRTRCVWREREAVNGVSARTRAN